MKGILPAGCRILGYALLILSVFAPLGMYMSGQVNDGNLAIVKLGMKLVIWLSLFMIFLAKHKEEDETAASLRTKAMKYALLAWGVYYTGVLVKGMADGDAQGAGNSAAIIYMVLAVLCLEFLVQKRKAEKAFKRK